MVNKNGAKNTVDKQRDKTRGNTTQFRSLLLRICTYILRKLKNTPHHRHRPYVLHTLFAYEIGQTLVIIVYKRSFEYLCYIVTCTDILNARG